MSWSHYRNSSTKCAQVWLPCFSLAAYFGRAEIQIDFNALFSEKWIYLFNLYKGVQGTFRLFFKKLYGNFLMSNQGWCIDFAKLNDQWDKYRVGVYSGSVFLVIILLGHKIMIWLMANLKLI